MNLIKFSHRRDFGDDYYIQVLFNKNWALFQGSISWNDEPSWPYFQLKSGMGSVISILFWVHRLGFDVGFIERTWNWDYMKDVDIDFENVKVELTD